MIVRLAVLFVACLAVASTAGAACLACVPDRPDGSGFCEPSSSGWCEYTCCLWDPGTPCHIFENVYRCSEGDPLVPSAYFATALPMQTEGSALRLRFGKGKPVAKQCAPSLMRRKSA